MMTLSVTFFVYDINKVNVVVAEKGVTEELIIFQFKINHVFSLVINCISVSLSMNIKKFYFFCGLSFR